VANGNDTWHTCVLNCMVIASPVFMFLMHFIPPPSYRCRWKHHLGDVHPSVHPFHACIWTKAFPTGLASTPSYICCGALLFVVAGQHLQENCQLVVVQLYMLHIRCLSNVLAKECC